MRFRNFHGPVYGRLTKIEKKPDPDFIKEIDDIKTYPEHKIMETKPPISPETAPQGVDENKEKRSKRILVADDGESNRKLFKDVLESEGYIVDMVVNGRELVDKIKNSGEKYDLVVSDYEMPEMDGVEALREIRGSAGFEKIPFVIVTAHYGPDIKPVIEKAGGVYIGKPFKIGNLLNEVEKGLAQNTA